MPLPLPRICRLRLEQFLLLALPCLPIACARGETAPIGNLYILSVGVDAVQTSRGDYDTNAHDALYIRQALVAAEPLYREARSKVLRGGAATPDAVRAALKWLVTEMKPSDVAVLYFRAHGDVDAGRGFQLLLDVPGERGKGDGADRYLWGTEIRDAVRMMEGRQIVWVDACHAGGLVADWNAEDAGAHAAFLLSCTATEFSAGQLERSDRPHGYFAIALCEALAGLADKDVDGRVTFDEIADYVPGRAAAFYRGQNAVVRSPRNFGSMPLAATLTGDTVHQLWTPRVARNPFGLPDVYNPDGDDVKSLVAIAKLPCDEQDENATAWPRKPVAGVRESIDGEWSSRWNSVKQPKAWQDGAAIVKSIGERVYVLYEDKGLYLLDLRRTGPDTLAGRYVNVGYPSDSSPWVGRIVSPDRIDGEWSGGRWDLRRVRDAGRETQ